MIFEASQQKDETYFIRRGDLYSNPYIQMQWKWFQLGWDLSMATKQKEADEQ